MLRCARCGKDEECQQYEIVLFGEKANVALSPACLLLVIHEWRIHQLEYGALITS